MNHLNTIHRFFLLPLAVLSACVTTAGVTKPLPSAPPVATTATVPTPPSVDASAAIPKTGNARFFELHESFLARGKAGPIGVLFLGDSITEG